MSRKKGSEKTGGRVAGTPNKVTSDLKTWVASILDNGRDKFVESLDKLEPSEYIRVFTGLLNYALPKQAPTTPDDVLKRKRNDARTVIRFTRGSDRPSSQAIARTSKERRR